MNKLLNRSFGFTLLFFALSAFAAMAQQPNFQQETSSSSSYQASKADHPLRIGFVNSKKCLEESKLGKQEQSNFEKMKKQMESTLQEKERELEEIESKLEDDDYMDSVSDEVASELKRKKRTIRTEGMQLQNQYMQTLQQANVKIFQKLADAIAKASAQVANAAGQQIDAVYTDEATTYFAPHLDVTKDIIAAMNANFDAEQKSNASKPR